MEIVSILMPLALFMILFGVGLNLPIHHLLASLRQPKAWGAGLLLQMVGLPILGLVVISLFGLEGFAAAGVILLTLAPGGATSNGMAMLARGDTALSVELTAVSSLLMPVTLPLIGSVLIAPYSVSLDGFDPLPLFLRLAVMAILPVMLGAIIRAYFESWCERRAGTIKLIAAVLMIGVVGTSLLQGGDQLGEIFKSYSLPILTLICLGMGFGAAVAWLLKLNIEQRVSMSIEVGVQNAAVVMFIGSYMGEMAIVLVALAYGVLMNLPAALLIIGRQLSAKPDRFVAQGNEEGA